MTLNGTNTFFTDNWEAILVGVIIAVVSGLLLYGLTEMLKRFTQRKLTKAERLKARLNQHRWELRNLGGVALQQVFYFILQMLIAGGTIILLYTSALGEYLSLIKDETTPSFESLRMFFWLLIGIPIVFTVWGTYLFAGPLRHILLLLSFSGWQERHLISRIKELEPDWKDTDF